MATHTQWFSCLFLAALLAGSAAPQAGAREKAAGDPAGSKSWALGPTK